MYHMTPRIAIETAAFKAVDLLKDQEFLAHIVITIKKHTEGNDTF